MSEAKPLSKQGETSPKPGRIEYLSTIEMRDESDEPEENGLCTVTFDAIPKQILPFLHSASAEKILKDPDSTLSFLLMEAEIPIADFQQALRFDGWCSITVSEDSTDNDGFYKATAIEFPQDGQEFSPKILYVKIDAARPDSRDLKAIKRVIECRHHPSAAFENLGIRPKGDLFVVVYDVGQASMSAIIDNDCNTKAFFDLGWPISVKRRSAPRCLGFDPFVGEHEDRPSPVFLSHLDWDHWGYAYQSGRATKDNRGFWKTEVKYRTNALERPWVMRRPSEKMRLGISHAHLLCCLQNVKLNDHSSALKFWPSFKKRVNWGACKIFSCEPTPGNHPAKYLRNNVALGILVENPQSHYYRRVLLCGDADYTSIAPSYKQNLGGIVAPHHGGRVTLNSIPAPDADTYKYRYMVFSTHQGCYSKIPSDTTIAEAQGLGWNISRTDERRACSCGYGERRNRWFSLSSFPFPKPSHKCTACFP